MQRGVARAEVMNNGTRRASFKRQRNLDTPPQVPQHIDLRVVRRINKDDPKYKDQWRDFLDDLGESSRPLGRCMTYGSLGITYVGATDMTHMVAEKYPKDFASFKRRPRVFEHLHDNLKEFIRAQSKVEFEKKIQHIAYQHETHNSFSFISEIEPESEYDDIAEEFSDGDLESITLKIKQLETPYGPATLAVKGLELYKRRQDKPHGRYGLDLSLNEQLYDERQGILSYLRGMERLDTSIVTPDWEPHAVIFEPHDHLTSVEPHHDETMPDRLSARPPQPEMYIKK
ncbi:MAG: hypothetical protein NVS1B7_8220 [Candidatus Saccharimonadales bacterium]